MSLLINILIDPMKILLIVSVITINEVKMYTIEGLDPAQPGFEDAHPSTRLDPTDALFVDVIHTKAKPFLPNIGLGIIKPADIMNYNFTWVEPAEEHILNRQTVRQACYGDLGCYNLDYPWVSRQRPIYFLPQPPESISTQFYLSTRRKFGDKRVHLKSRPHISFNGTDFNATHWTVFLTHGYNSHAGKDSWIRDLEIAVLLKGDVNIITCDWSHGSQLMNYVQVAANARIVGAEIARIAHYLLNNNLASRNRLHLIGQSLGAHAMSYAAANITSVARLTGLDPAQPGFEDAHPSTRLDPTDALFVDVIHTNAKPFLPNIGLGIIKPAGHVDFFVNGGEFQPGCISSLRKYLIQYENLMDILSAPFRVITDYLTCSHKRAYQYYTESLQSKCSFWARKWKISGPSPPWFPCSPQNCQEMGKFTGLLPARGSFYIHTKSTSPFCVSDPTSERTMMDYIYKIYNYTIVRDLYD